MKLFRFIPIILFIACQQRIVHEAPVVHLQSNDSTLHLSDYADSIRYIPLKTNKKVLMSGSIQIKFSQNHILILDRGVQQVLLFDTEGELIRSISSLGRSHEEFGELLGGAIDEKNNTIIIGDNIRKRLLLFTLDNEFIREIPLNYYYGVFHLIDDQKIVIYTAPSIHQEEHAPNLQVVDYKGNTVFQEKLPLAFENARNQFANFYQYQDRLCITPRNSVKDSVFYLSPEYKLLPHLAFDYEGKPNKTLLKNDSLYNKIGKKGISINMYPLESERLVFFPFATENSYVKDLIYDKVIGKSYNVYTFQDNQEYRGILNDIDGGLPFMPDQQINEEWLYQIVTPNVMMNYQKHKLPTDTLIRNAEAHQRLSQLVSQVTMDDDPIIQLVRFKKDM
jgi:hypothetical protein